MHYVVADGRAVAEIIHHQANPNGQVSSTEVLYLQTDGQGSVTQTIRDSGTVAEEFFYDPFGRRTDPDYNPLAPRHRGIRRGYTGHEHDDPLALINMRGRVYDPTTRRFLTPDPVSHPLIGQSLNRYSYVRNNPATLIDPTGFDPEDNGFQCIYVGLIPVCGGGGGSGPPSGPPNGGGTSGGNGGETTPDGGSSDDDDIIHSKRSHGSGRSGSGPSYGWRSEYSLNGPAVLDGEPRSILEGFVVESICVLMGCNNAWAPEPTTRTEPRRGLGEETVRYGTFIGAGVLGRWLGGFFGRAGSRGVTARGAVGDGVGAMRRLRYEPAPYHGRVGSGVKSRGPTNGQAALDNSLQVTETSARRVGIDPGTNEFVIFDRTSDGLFHGHVRTWNELRPVDRAFLREEFGVSGRGKIPE